MAVSDRHYIQEIRKSCSFLWRSVASEAQGGAHEGEADEGPWVLTRAQGERGEKGVAVTW